MSSASLTAPPSGLNRLWQRLALPVDPVIVADALVGLHPVTARQLLAVALATCHEAEELLDGLPGVLRSLAVATASHPVRCEGEIRGPVLWSETMAARSASPGAGGVFICSSPTRAYDTDENRVLVAALHRLYRAAMAAEHHAEGPFQPRPDDLARARRNGEAVRRAMEHRSLLTVRRMRPNGRMMQKARTGTKAGVFRTAVALLQRSWATVGADDLAPFVDDDTRAQHILAADVIDVLHARGEIQGRLNVADDALVAGSFAYRHPRGRSAARGEPAGVVVGGRPITALTDLR